MSSQVSQATNQFSSSSTQSFPLQKQIAGISRFSYGCMGLGGGWTKAPLTQENIKQAHEVVEAVLDVGINFFDHADIYTRGNAEETFSHLFKADPHLREKMIIQTKCGIRFADEENVGRFDQSASYILSAVDASLKRLGTEYIDILLLHRPDALIEPDEVAKAFDELVRTGKVRHFGVSNMHAGQLKLLQRSLNQPILVNQLEMSLLKHDWVDAGTTFNDDQSKSNRVIGETVEHCRLEGIQLQAWGSMSYGYYSGATPKEMTPAISETQKFVAQYAEQYKVSKEAIVLAWLLRHPANIQPVIGTTNLDRIRGCAEALSVNLTREEWYRLYVTARGKALP